MCACDDSSNLRMASTMRVRASGSLMLLSTCSSIASRRVSGRMYGVGSMITSPRILRPISSSIAARSAFFLALSNGAGSMSSSAGGDTCPALASVRAFRRRWPGGSNIALPRTNLIRPASRSLIMPSPSASSKAASAAFCRSSASSRSSSVSSPVTD